MVSGKVIEEFGECESVLLSTPPSILPSCLTARGSP